MKKYHLEIYEPDSFRDVQVSLESDTSFMALSKGDLVNPRVWEGADLKGLLKVVNVEHIVWDYGNDPKHKICVYTTLIPDTEESRRA